MKRGKALERRTPLRSNSQLARVGKLRARSAKTAALYRTVRIPIVRRLLLVYPVCQWPGGCPEPAVDVHELRKRSQGGSISDPDNLRTSCRFHNGWAEDFPAESAAIGWTRRATA